MSNPAPQLVQKLWYYCNILRDDGLSYGDYVEQLTFLLFLKMADEQSKPPFNRLAPVPPQYSASFSARRKIKSRTRPSCAGSLWISSTRSNGRASPPT